jgi:hypothetical protein
MNERIKELAEQAGYTTDMFGIGHWDMPECKKFAELIVRECANICMEMSAKCAGLEGDGVLAKDCADWIKKDFGIE